MLVIPAPSVARIYLCMPIGTRALWRCDLALFPAEFATLERVSPCQHWAEDCVAIVVAHRAAALSSFAPASALWLWRPKTDGVGVRQCRGTRHCLFSLRPRVGACSSLAHH